MNVRGKKALPLPSWNCRALSTPWSFSDKAKDQMGEGTSEVQTPAKITLRKGVSTSIACKEILIGASCQELHPSECQPGLKNSQHTLQELLGELLQDLLTGKLTLHSPSISEIRFSVSFSITFCP